MSDNKEQNKQSKSRRQLLKATIAGTGAVLAGKSLPEQWSRPLVESVTLPAHAETSVISAGGSLMLSLVMTDNTIIDMLVPTAHAENSNVSVELCCYLNPNGLVDVSALVFNSADNGNCSGDDIAYFSGQVQQGVETELNLNNGECNFPSAAGITVMFSNGTASGDFWFETIDVYASPFNFSNPACPFGTADIPAQCAQGPVGCIEI